MKMGVSAVSALLLQSRTSTAGEYDEYAKIVRVRARTPVKGIRVALALPRTTTLPNGGDYINFYCGLDNYECGISTANRPEFSGRWRWFVHNPLEWSTFSHGTPSYLNGETMDLQLFIDKTRDDRVIFQVNGVTQYVSLWRWSSPLEARFVFAAAQATGARRPLQRWEINHDWASVHDLQLLDELGTWQRADRRTVYSEKDHWPRYVATVGTVDYEVDERSLDRGDIFTRLSS